MPHGSHGPVNITCVNANYDREYINTSGQTVNAIQWRHLWNDQSLLFLPTIFSSASLSTDLKSPSRFFLFVFLFYDAHHKTTRHGLVYIIIIIIIINGIYIALRANSAAKR